MKNIPYLIFGFIMMLSPGCDFEKNNDVEDAVRDVVIDKPNVPAFMGETITDTTGRTILKTIYKNYSDTRKASVVDWINLPKRLKKRASVLFDDTEIIARFEKTVLVGDGRHLAYFKLLPSENFECRVCAPILSGALLKQEDGKWKLGSPTYFDLAGTYGIAPDIKIIPIASDDYAVVAGLADLHMGISWSADNFYSLNNNLENILLVTTETDNSGACDLDNNDDSLMPCYENETSIEWIKKPNGYYDVKTHKTGTTWDYEQDKLITLNEIKTFTFQNGKYMELSPK